MDLFTSVEMQTAIALFKAGLPMATLWKGSVDRGRVWNEGEIEERKGKRGF